MRIRQTTKRDLKSFIPAYHDILEAKALGIPPSFPEATECVSLVHNEEVLAIGGNHGDQCWFVTSEKTEGLSRVSKLRFRRVILEYRNWLLRRYPTLWNYVWVGNEPHIRFLKSIGAVFHEDYTHDGKFQLFTIRR